MNSIYCYSASINQRERQDDGTNEEHLSPPIILVGTHRNSFTNSTKNLLVKNFENLFIFIYFEYLD
jgi:hypothetical protein